MLKQPAKRDLLPLPTLLALLLSLALIAAPHILRQPVWLIVLVATCGVWRYLIARRREQMPPAWLRTLLTIAAVIGIFGSYGSLLGRDAGTALLLAMTALKLLEMRQRRDLYVLLYLGYLLIATQFLYDQSLFMVLYLAVSSWLMTMFLMTAEQLYAPFQLQRYARRAVTLLVQALPIMLILFVLFPRMAGPLWKLPDDAHSATTGLSDTMSPGSITDLSQSDEVAFRVEFEGPPPVPKERYWRGPVLASYDGRSWRQARAQTRPVTVKTQSEPIRYSVLLEPHNRRWLFALDAPISSPANSRWGDGLSLLATDQVRDRLRYSMQSVISHQLQPELSPAEQRRFLALPADAHPRAQELAARWRQLPDQEIVAAAAAFFAERPFSYTLRPPPLPDDPVDQFLFETQRGFCEHYASAFAVLMRAAGVPSRVVTGYLGGEINQLGNYMIVRQSDAHAWTEVWLQGQGWQRIDATGWIAPQRIERGLGEALSADEPVPRLARSGGLLKALNLQWDAINTGWNRWVLGYGPKLQRQVLDRAGLGGWQRMTAALAAAVAAVLGMIAWGLLRERRFPREPAAVEYARFCRKLNRRGLARLPSEAPYAYATRVIAARPELASQVQAITAAYIRLRYDPPNSSPPAILHELREAVRAFSP